MTVRPWLLHLLRVALCSLSLAAADSFAQAAAPADPPKKEHFNHSAWTKGLFAEAVTVSGIGGATFVYLAGVGAEDENGTRGTIRHRGDFEAQCRYAWDKIRRILAAHGASLRDAVKVTTYLTDIRYRVDSGKCLAENFAAEKAELPVHTLLEINHLAFPEMMIEVDLTAVVAPK